jgi:hypothetical protein
MAMHLDGAAAGQPARLRAAMLQLTTEPRYASPYP